MPAPQLSVAKVLVIGESGYAKEKERGREREGGRKEGGRGREESITH
jgi:hypothetical protein